MIKYKILFVFPITLVIISLFLFSSCTTTRKTKYFADIPDSGKLIPLPVTTYVDPKIQIDDILTIVVETLDPQATAGINLGNIPISSSSSQIGGPALSSQTIAGYLVDKDGNVELPVIGKIKVAGYTTSQAKEVIYEVASKYYAKPTVIVRYANFKITVAGEVAKPGVYVVPNEKLNITDALAMAGDLTVYGKRENILLIRTNDDGSKTPYRVNLQKSAVMNEPYFYLRQNDYLYVEPTKAKAAANDLAEARNLTIVSSVLSVLIILVSRIK